MLGVQWLRNYNLITFDFDQLQLSFNKEDKTVVLQGESDMIAPIIQLMSSGEFKQTLNTTTHGYFGYLFGLAQDSLGSTDFMKSDLEIGDIKENNQFQSQLEEVLQSYSAVFKEPKGLPPNRSHDHHINLKEGSQPINLRPYRYPYVQKEEIEKIVSELMASGVIHPSNSLYAFLVLLVKKHDGSWRMCVDYRSLNEMTVKDKFPIPAINELLDELHGSRWYFKLNLRYGYHQIRV